ncbi:hypothetical protein [Enterococcus sp. 5H]|uniref:hypothetical protein n=1 Tax=Enterococcus sp. 5H TaxID=1229490 RepID=UPI0023045E8F|nr:hypothetical protein [Enterococcus sp. 5H]MDA9472635.1 hypothetical protein [Enterococcus sp. 5H]
MKVKLELQGKEPEIIEVESFDLQNAVEIINGFKTNEQGNPLQGFMVGTDKYVRALEVVSIDIIQDGEADD